MNESANNCSEATSTELVKPVQLGDDIKFPPFPEPSDLDFEDDISQDERSFYKVKFSDLNSIKALRLHCTACDRHLGCSARNEARMRSHPMLRTLVCHTCHTFYNSGEFEKGDDGSELYCRWCGQGGQVYCCSDCCHVFCAKCIKRNLGATKIKEIENADDWKCFKCNNRCLWDIRATCWALLRYCDLKNKITYQTQDPVLKEAYQKDCAIDHSECCKNKNKRKEKFERKKDVDTSSKRAAAVAAMSKIPPTIQVKKFASINLDDQKPEKKAQKRSASPKNKSIIMQKPIPIASGPKILTPCMPPIAKKMRMPNATMMNPIRIQKDNRLPMNSYARIKPKPHMPLILNNSFNGFQSPGMFTNMVVNDNINLSLESLTQGLDMSAVASMANNFVQDDDLVCTPDFPLEPLCEVTEDNTDDDVQCITPAPITAPKMNTPPPLISRSSNMVLPDLTSDNIIQMTENDVTVNAATGGLKFRVDPQTLSSNKMYRLPDGRIFAINANPNMPGGYSATIVAVTENTSGKAVTPKGATYAAKLSAVSSLQNTPPVKPNKQPTPRSSTKRQTPKATKANKNTENRNCDLNVPIEWFRYNLIDAFDALEYSMSRIQKLKKEATTVYLRSRTVDEMKSLHKQIDRLLNTSTTRFKEIRESLNKEMKQYIAKKEGSANASDDDDDVEILNDVGDNDDPIFIDENSMESNVNETQEVDLTDVASSEHNDSVDKSIDHNETSVKDPLACNEIIDETSNADSTIAGNDLNTNEEDVLSTEKTELEKDQTNESKEVNNKINDQQSDENHEESKIDDVTVNGEKIVPDIKSEKNNKGSESDDSNKDKNKATNASNEGIESEESNKDENNDTNASNVKIENTDTSAEKIQDSEISEGNIEETNKINDVDMSEDKTQDTEENTEMSEEMIETLLKDNVDDGDNSQNVNCMDIPDGFQEP